MTELLPVLGLWVVVAVLACGLGLAVAALEVDLGTWELRRTTPTLEIRAAMWRGLVVIIATGALLSVILSAPSSFNMAIVRVGVLALVLAGAVVGYLQSATLWPKALSNLRIGWRWSLLGLAFGVVLLVAAYAAWTAPRPALTGQLVLLGTGDRALLTLVSAIPRLPVVGASVVGVASILVMCDLTLRLTSSKASNRRSPATMVLAFGSLAVALVTLGVASRLNSAPSVLPASAAAAALLTVVATAYLVDQFMSRSRQPLHAGIALLASASAAACVPWALPVLVVTATIFAINVLRLRRKRERRAVMADIVTTLGPVLALLIVVVAGWLVSMFVVL